jgi:hypothetical protein
MNKIKLDSVNFRDAIPVMFSNRRGMATSVAVGTVDEIEYQGQLVRIRAGNNTTYIPISNITSMIPLESSTKEGK